MPSLFHLPTKNVFPLLNIITQIDHGAAIGRYQLDILSSIVPLMKLMHFKMLPSLEVHFLDFRIPQINYAKMGSGTAKAYIANNLILEFNPDLRMRHAMQ